MANTNTSQRIKSAGNPFTKDKSLAAMKKRWSNMTPAQRKANVENFRSAAKGKPKTQTAAAQPSAHSRRKKAFDGVGPSDSQRLKDSSPEAMAAQRKKRNTATSQRITDAMVADANKKRSRKPKTQPTSKPVSGRNALAMRQAERNRNRASDPKNETRTRYVRTAGGGRKRIYEIKRNGKWVRAGGKG